MDSTRFQLANETWKTGNIEGAAREYRSMAEEAPDPNEKAALLANEHKCYCQLRRLRDAEKVMSQIRALPVQDKFVLMIVDFGDACMTTLMGKLDNGVRKFEKILESNEKELKNPENKYLYEDIQERRGFALTNLGRYAEALAILKEATSFTSDRSDLSLVNFYIGVCYQDTSQPKAAKEFLLRAIKLGLKAEFEADARYRLGILYFIEHAFAQAKLQLELAQQLPTDAVNAELRKDIYQQMSRVCHYLGETDEEQRYLTLKNSL